MLTCRRQKKHTSTAKFQQYANKLTNEGCENYSCWCLNNKQYQVKVCKLLWYEWLQYINQQQGVIFCCGEIYFWEIGYEGSSQNVECWKLSFLVV
jgi:hypothetical protein